MSAASILRLVAAMSAVAIGALVARAPVAHAEAPLRPHQAPGYYRIMVGDFESTALYDGGVGIDSALLRGNAQQIRAPLRRSMHVDRKYVWGSVVGDLLNAGSKLVLIDAGTSRPWSAKIASFICGTRGARPVTFGDVPFAGVSSIRSKEGSER